MTERYSELGGLKRPDAYFGAIEFDCPTCYAKAKRLNFPGEKCRQFNELTQRWDTKKCPCLARIKLADKSSTIF